MHHLTAKFCISLRYSEFGAILIWFRIISLQNLIIFWVLHHLIAKILYKSSIQWGRSNLSLISHHLIAKSNSSLRANKLEANLIWSFPSFLIILTFASICKSLIKRNTYFILNLNFYQPSCKIFDGTNLPAIAKLVISNYSHIYLNQSSYTSDT